MQQLSELNWREFLLTDVFTEIRRGRRLKKENHILGDAPYISSTALNNGVDAFVGNRENVRAFSQCLTVANSGSVGACFYHPYSFIASDHVTMLKNETFNKYVYLFVATMVSRLAHKYSFNRELKDTRIRREKILLPATADGTPDYAFMENYMKAMEAKLLRQYRDFLHRQNRGQEKA